MWRFRKIRKSCCCYPSYPKANNELLNHVKNIKFSKIYSVSLNKSLSKRGGSFDSLELFSLFKIMFCRVDGVSQAPSP